MSKEITQSRLKDIVEYNPKTGVFRWRESKVGKIKAGAKAGCRTEGDNIVIRIEDKLYKAHRLAWMYCFGIFPDKYLEHIDGNNKNNAIDNLREYQKIGKAKDISQERLVKLLKYNPNTGVFTWKGVGRRGKGYKGVPAGTINNHGYVVICVDGNCLYAHRLAWLYMYGQTPVGVVDHKDRNPSNNVFSNLRDIPQAGNSINQKKHTNNTSGVNGVTWCKLYRKWKAQIMVNRKMHNLGYFDTLLKAAEARHASEVKFDFIKYNKRSSSSEYIEAAHETL